MDIYLGETVPLFFQTFDCSYNQFVKAFVFDADDSEIDNSPVLLTPSGVLGKYVNNDLVMPDTTSLQVQFIVYSDEACTIISPNQGAGSEQFGRHY